jgi:hypothetical protein
MGVKHTRRETEKALIEEFDTYPKELVWKLVQTFFENVEQKEVNLIRIDNRKTYIHCIYGWFDGEYCTGQYGLNKREVVELKESWEFDIQPEI